MPRKYSTRVLSQFSKPPRAFSMFNVRYLLYARLQRIAYHVLSLSQVTTHRFHAKEIAAAMDLDIDAIVALSGDGLPHEIINGFASRTDAVAALRIPIVPVPTGSANGFNINLHGPKVREVAMLIFNSASSHANYCCIRKASMSVSRC